VEQEQDTVLVVTIVLEFQVQNADPAMQSVGYASSSLHILPD